MIKLYTSFLMLSLCFSSPLMADEIIRGEQRQLLKRMAPVAGEGRWLRIHNTFFIVIDQGIKVLLMHRNIRVYY